MKREHSNSQRMKRTVLEELAQEQRKYNEDFDHAVAAQQVEPIQAAIHVTNPYQNQKNLNLYFN